MQFLYVKYFPSILVSRPIAITCPRNSKIDVIFVSKDNIWDVSPEKMYNKELERFILQLFNRISLIWEKLLKCVLLTINNN